MAVKTVALSAHTSENVVGVDRCVQIHGQRYNLLRPLQRRYGKPDLSHTLTYQPYNIGEKLTLSSGEHAGPFIVVPGRVLDPSRREARKPSISCFMAFDGTTNEACI